LIEVKTSWYHLLNYQVVMCFAIIEVRLSAYPSHLIYTVVVIRYFKDHPLTYSSTLPCSTEEDL
jgi:hypothetical protein